MYVIPFGSDFRPERYRVLDFAAYYRYIKARLEKAVEQKPATNAEPTAHCDICRWWPECDGSREGYAKVREQARVQVAGRNQGRDLVRQGKKVGITATSHKVIRNLLDEVIAAGKEMNLDGLRCIQRVKEKPDIDPPGITLTTDNAEPLKAMNNGISVVASTAWLCAREEYFESVDVLFVDEAGQMSLANVLAASQAAKNLVLLGDPQQLEQPLKGSHPQGADISALEHLLAGAKTIPTDKGLFLEKTWRLHPKLCEFTSEVFYESGFTRARDLRTRKSKGTHGWANRAFGSFRSITRAIRTRRRRRSST
jgi:AAA domain